MSKIVDLSAYGMDWSLDPIAMMGVSVPGDYMTRIQNMRIEGIGPSRLVGPKESYVLGKLLGRGTYGEVYKASRQSDGKELVVKINRNANLKNMIKETIINILIVKETESFSRPDINLVGPFAPRIYDFGYHAATGEGFIVSEMMRNSVHGALVNGQADKAYMLTFVKTVLLQLTVILHTLGQRLRFNHRDFKTDNCMYIRDAAGQVQVRLIDFGFSCITYDGIYIASASGPAFQHCFLPSRDMTQFLYEMYKYHAYLPVQVRSLLTAVLTFPDPSGRACKMYKGCKGMKAWRNSYEFLNDKAVVNPNCQPDNLFHIAMAFYSGRPWRPLLQAALSTVPIPVAAPAVAVAQCPAGKVWNPNTRRCVLATGTVGRALLATAAVAPAAVGPAAIGIKACPATKPDYNPATRRCVKACPAGKRRNATTFKCVAAGAKRVAAVKRVASAKRKPKAAAAAAVAAKVKVCPPAKPDYNPATRRCVKACPAGKRRNATTFKCVK